MELTCVNYMGDFRTALAKLERSSIGWKTLSDMRYFTSHHTGRGNYANAYCFRSQEDDGSVVWRCFLWGSFAQKERAESGLTELRMYGDTLDIRDTARFLSIAENWAEVKFSEDHKVATIPWEELDTFVTQCVMSSRKLQQICEECEHYLKVY